MAKKNKEYRDGTFISFGIGLGTLYGIIFDHLAIGISLGLIFGVLLDQQQKKKKKSDKQE